jgi:D-beta-D-heptose 7-phosphate kinase/D-beta-D-heptose 1-phosphate adenosyltransferase
VRKLEHKLIAKPLAKFGAEWGQVGLGKLVFTNGCFDILHAGHVGYLQRAKELGAVLVVGINDDTSVRHIKGVERPINKLLDRMTVIAALECVDHVFPIHHINVVGALKDLKPAIWTKGGDYSMNTLNVKEREAAREVRAEIVLIDHIESRSTTEILSIIRNSR